MENMMPSPSGETQFAITYPCFFVVSPDGASELVEIDGIICLSLFIHPKQAMQFCRDKYGADCDANTVKVWELTSQEALLRFLRQLQPQLVDQDCRHLAIDVQPNQPIAYALIDEILGEW
jgi:hypothetical protein